PTSKSPSPPAATPRGWSRSPRSTSSSAAWATTWPTSSTSGCSATWRARCEGAWRRSLLLELPADQVGQRVERDLGIGAVGTDNDHGTVAGREHHQAHDAL